MDEELTFGKARERLEQIIDQLKSKEIDLDKSIDLLEEGVRIAALCSERLADEASIGVEGAAEDAHSAKREDSPPPADRGEVDFEG